MAVEKINLALSFYSLTCSVTLCLVMGFHERELVEKLLEHYHTGLRPVITNSSKPTLVNISLKLVQIFEMVSKIGT